MKRPTLFGFMWQTETDNRTWSHICNMVSGVGPGLVLLFTLCSIVLTSLCRWCRKTKNRGSALKRYIRTVITLTRLTFISHLINKERERRHVHRMKSWNNFIWSWCCPACVCLRETDSRHRFLGIQWVHLYHCSQQLLLPNQKLLRLATFCE